MPRKKAGSSIDLAVASALRQYREAAGLSQEEAADLIGADKTTLSRYENGNRAVTPTNLYSLAVIYGTDPGSFFPVTNAVEQAKSVLRNPPADCEWCQGDRSLCDGTECEK